MIVSIVFCFLMSLVITFFVLAGNGFSLISIFYGIFLLILYSGMTFSEARKKGSSSIFRRIFLITFAVLFCISFIGTLFDERGSMAITNEAMASSELPFCHIAIPQVLLPFLITNSIIFPARVTGHYTSIASMLGLWLIFTLTIGRGWCGWVCFYGGWDEAFSHASKKKRLNLLSRNKEIRDFQFGFFFFIVLACIGTMSAVYCSWFCPFKLVTEFNPMTTIPGLIGGVLFIGLFLGLAVILPLVTKRRTQCSTLCPFDAFASLTDRVSIFKMEIDTEKCIGCLKCANACPFGALDIETIRQKKGAPELTCAKCGECVSVCPANAISYQFRFASKCKIPAPSSKFEKVIRSFLDPANLFRFVAFTFGTVMSGSFAVDSISRILASL